MRQLEKEKMAEMEKILSEGIEEPDLLVNLFSGSVHQEMATYSKKWEDWSSLEPNISSPELN